MLQPAGRDTAVHKERKRGGEMEGAARNQVSDNNKNCCRWCQGRAGETRLDWYHRANCPVAYYHC